MNRARTLLLAVCVAAACARAAAQAPATDKEFATAPDPKIEVNADQSATAAKPEPAPQPAEPKNAGKPDKQDATDKSVAAAVPSSPPSPAPVKPAEPVNATPALPAGKAPAAAPKPAQNPPPAEPDYFQHLADEVNRPDTPAAAANAPAKIPVAGESVGYLRTFAVLCVLCAIVVLGGYLAKRYGRNTPLLAGQRFGTVVGRVYLAPGVALHYVKTGGRMLIVGVNARGMYPVADLDAAMFDELLAQDAAAPDAGAPMPGAFLSQLRLNTQGNAKLAVDGDLSLLRSEIQQLQEYLRTRPGDQV